MAKNKLSFSNFLKTFLEITEIDNHTKFFPILNFFSIILYFTHMLSYLLKFQWRFDDDKLNFLSGIIFYSFFPNLLLFFNSRLITLFSYILTLIITAFYFVYVVIFTLFNKRIKRNIALRNICQNLTVLYAFSFRFYFWIFLLPTLEIFINPLFCNNSGSYLSCNDKFGLPFVIISIIAVIISLSLGVIYVIIYHTYTFLDLNSIPYNTNFFNLISFMLRILLPFLSQLFHENFRIVYYFFLLFIGFCSLFDYWENFPIRTTSLNRLYISSLLLFIIFLVVCILKDFSAFIIEESIFILVLLLGVLSVKLGFTFFYKKYFYLISKNFSVSGFVDYSLEELIILFENQNASIKYYFFLIGMLKTHAKKCHDSTCKLNEKHMTLYNRMNCIDQKRKLCSFIAQKLNREIDNLKRRGQLQQMEHLMLKYVSYLNNSGLNPSKCLYEIMLVITLYSNRSYLTMIAMKRHLKKAHLKLKDVYRERSMSKKMYEDDKTLEISTFFQIQKEKLNFEKNMKKLLQSKMVFWEHYKQGFNSYEEIIAELYKLVKNVFRFREKLERSLNQTSNENLVTLKFSSIYSCIIMNHLQEAHKVEDEIENIKKRYIKINKNCLSPLSFLEDNLVTCEASFMKLDGLILEKSKTDKLAHFLGYNAEEFKNVKYITEFMPEIIATNHKSFINYSFAQTRKEMVHSKSLIMSFAKDKKGFLFPLKIFLGHSLTNNRDYVMHAALMNLNSNEAECLLFHKNGLIIGCTEQILRIFNDVYENFSSKSLELLNIYSLVPKIKLFVESNNAFKNETGLVLRNLNATLLYPQNMNDVLEVLKFKRDDFLTIERNKHSIGTSFYTNNSFNTNRRTNGKTEHSEASSPTAKLESFLSRYNKKGTIGLLNKKKDFILQALNIHDDDGNEATIQGLIDMNSMKKRKFNFDLSFHSHRYGKREDEHLGLCWLKVNNAGTVENADFTNFENNGKLIKGENFKDVAEDAMKVGEDTITISGASKGIEMPKENVAQFGFEFEREANLSFFSDDKRALNDKLVIMGNSQMKVENNNNIGKNWDDDKYNGDNQDFLKESDFKTQNNNKFINENNVNENDEAKQIKIDLTENIPGDRVKKQGETAETIGFENKVPSEKVITEQITNGTNAKHNFGKERVNAIFLLLKNEIHGKSPRGKSLNPDNNTKNLKTSNLNHKPSSKFTVSSKSKEKEKAQIEKLKGENTEKDQMFDHIEKNSQKESSVKTSKQTYAIFNTVKLIQNKLPRSIFFVIFSLNIQILVILLYCLIIYFFATSYVADSYLPLQRATINQCRINMGIDISALVINEYEYLTDGLGLMTDFQDKELRRILSMTYERTKTLFYGDRDTKYSFSFASYFQNLYVPFTDFRNPNQTKMILFTDFTDTLLQICNSFVSVNNFTEVYDYLKVFQRNFPSYATGAKTVRNSIQAEFTGSIDIMTNNIVIVLSFMMSIVAITKLFELFFFSSYYLSITKLINIFLRISTRDALNDLALNKEILNLLQNPTQSYLHYYYPDAYLHRKEFAIEREEGEFVKGKKKKGKKDKLKAGKVKKNKTSLFSLRRISKNRVYIFIAFTLTIGLGYFLSNYYFWTITAQNVANLLQINTIFSELFIYSTTDLCFLNFLIREKVYTDSEYRFNPETTQNHSYRLNYFYSNYYERLTKLKTYVSEIPNYAFPAQRYIQDHSYTTILGGDTCQNLMEDGVITEDLMKYCDSLFNTASLSGILSVLNEFIKFQSQNPLATLIDEKNETVMKQQKILIETYLNDYSRSDIVIGSFYLSEELYILYNILNAYYLNVLNLQKTNLQTFIWITCIGFSLILAIATIFTWTYLTRVYRHVANSLTLIPYEKIVNDEQTNFLTKQFWKEHI